MQNEEGISKMKDYVHDLALGNFHVDVIMKTADLFDTAKEIMMVNQRQELEKEGKELKIAIVQGIIRFILSSIVLGGALFGAAGTIAWMRGWIYLGITLLILLASRVILFITDPAAAMHRSKRVRPALPFDKLFYALSTPLLLVLLVVAGLDAERFGWSYLSMSWAWVGSCAFLLFGGVLHLAPSHQSPF
jgi:hypothetical protein